MIQDIVNKIFHKEMTQAEYCYNYAKSISSRLSDPGKRKKSYVDLMGILAILNYLKEQGYDCKTERSLHKSPSILEMFDITDIYFNNYRIDIITNFNTNITKIPRCHMDYDIMPDYYIVVKMAQNLNDFRILGYLRPEDVVMSYHDAEYYYPDKRLPIKDLFKTILGHRKKLPNLIDKHANCESLFLRFIEGELSFSNKKSFIQHLTTCESCTKSFQLFEKYHIGMKNIEQYPLVYQVLHDKVVSFNPVLYKKIREEKSKSLLPEFMNKIYNFSDNLVDFITNISWDEKGRVNPHKNLTKKQEVEYIFDENPTFNIEAFSKLFEKKKVVFLIAAIVIIIFGGIIGIISISANSHKISFDDSNIASSEEIENKNVSQYDYSEKNETYSYDGYEISPVEYNSRIERGDSSGIIKNVSWEVPSKISKNKEYLGFLQAVGKNIKLRLENDLIIADEIPSNKNIKVDVQFSGNTSVMGIKVVKSSGSNSIDDLIQKNIFQAFTYMDSPKVGKEKITLTLVIDL